MKTTNQNQQIKNLQKQINKQIQYINKFSFDNEEKADLCYKNLTSLKYKLFILKNGLKDE